MASNIYELLAQNLSVNQGAYGQAVRMKRWRFLIPTSLDYRLTPANFTALTKKLTDDAVNNTAANRIQIIGTIEEAEAANSNAITLNYNYGQEQQPYDGQYGMRVFFADNDLARQQRRQAYNGRGSEFLIIVVDEDFTFCGTSDATGTFRGFTPAEIRAMNVAIDPGVGVKQGMFVSFANSAEFNNGNLLCIPTKTNPANIKLVADVTIKVIADMASRVVTLALMVEGSNIGTNLAERYATELAATPNLLLAFNHATGATVAVSSAAPAVLNGQHGITYTFSSTNYPASGGSLDVRLDNVSAVIAALQLPFETPVTLNIPV